MVFAGCLLSINTATTVGMVSSAYTNKYIQWKYIISLKFHMYGSYRS